MEPVFPRRLRRLAASIALLPAVWLNGCDTQVPIGTQATDAPIGSALDGGIFAIGTGGASGTGGAIATGGETGKGGSTSPVSGTITPDAALVSAGAGGSGTSVISGTGGSNSLAGNVGTGGVSGTGGSPGSGGSTGSGGGGGATGGDCMLQSARLSSRIATVGIVTWASTVSGLKSARIDFGLASNYGMTAPVDTPTSGVNTTLLLGMKQSKTYHYRITAKGSDGDCVGPDATIQTGSLMSGLPKITVDTKDPAALFGGFLITGQFVNISGVAGIPAYIADADGDIVWAVVFPKDTTGAVMSYDGKSMWINNANVPEDQAIVQRVSMDGLTVEDKSSSFVGLARQLTVLPDETVAFFAYNSSKKCEDIKEYSPTTSQVRVIVNAADAQGATSCHLNNIQYSRWDDALVFSDMDNQTVVKVKRGDGSTVWILNGAHATYTGDTWKGSQTGIHLLDLDRFLLFNNNSRFPVGSSGGDGSGSMAIELQLDHAAKTITKVWSYKSDIANDVMGDLQRLDNGNTLIAYSTKGIVQEVGADGALLQEWILPLGSSMGYIQKRKTLYGPPPR